MKNRMNKNTKRFIIVAVILILLFGGYLGVKAYNNSQQKKGLKIFEQGIKYGYTEALLQIINISDKCQPFPVYVGNNSRELVSVTCYKNQQAK
jgi:hypothetical protein